MCNRSTITTHAVPRFKPIYQHRRNPDMHICMSRNSGLNHTDHPIKSLIYPPKFLPRTKLRS
uniref:Uncharacterized protein n=1 Tax=Arundo donax TaxID=35708 RepID=A0A0A9BAM0_ARUDO